MRKVLWVTAVLLVSVAAAQAGNISVDVANPINVTLLGFNGGNWQNGYPYYLSFGIGGSVTVAMCDDYLHGGAPGMSWTANATVLGSNDLSLARFNMVPHALTLYDEAGWLLLQTVVEPQNQWKDMNYAVWHIFDPSLPLGMNAQAWLNAAEAEAVLGFPGVDFNEVKILTPVNQHDSNLNDPQEFLYLHIGGGPGSSQQSGTTPEPGSLLLMGTGAMALFRRRLTA